MQPNIVGAQQPKNLDFAAKFTDAVPLLPIDLIEEIVAFFAQTKALISIWYMVPYAIANAPYR